MGGEPVIARLSDAAGTPVGAGVLVAPDRVLTCAHVVARILGLSDDAPDAPPASDTITLDLPWSVDTTPRTAAIASAADWRPGGHDTAVLTLETAVAVWPGPPSLAYPDTLADRPFRTVGFPADHGDGRWENGTVARPDAAGMLQLRPDAVHPYFVGPGFSGAPAIDRETGEILGLVATADRDPGNRQAHLLDPRVIERAWPPLAAPYLGVRAFDEATGRWFRGREGDAEAILARLDEERVVAVVGASGSGKSSVVRAGVIPALRTRGWEILPCRVGDDPMKALADALGPLLYTQVDRGTRRDRIRALTAEFRTASADALERLDDLAGAGRPGVLVLFDQFEEIVTRADAGARAAFDALSVALTGDRAPARLRLVLTLRSDFEDAIAAGLPESANRLLNHGRVRLTPMRRQALAAAASGPARDLGVAFEDAIDGAMIDAVTRNAALLPSLQYALRELWQAQAARTIPAEAYETMGGLDGVLVRKAEEVFASLDEAGRAAAERLFADHLVAVTDQGVAHDTKQAATRGRIGEAGWAAAQAFAAEGVWLLTTRKPDGAPDTDATAEIAHEALIRTWDRLRTWLDAVRAFRLWQAEMRRQAAASQDSFREVFTDKEAETARAMLGRGDVPEDVAAFARFKLGNTEADRIWSDVRSESKRDAGLLALAGAAEWETRRAFAQGLLSDEVLAEAYLKDFRAITRALVGVSTRHRRPVTEEIDLSTWDMLSPMLLCSRVQLAVAMESPPELEVLLGALQETTDPDQCDALGHALAAVSASAPDASVPASALLAALRETTDPGECQTLGQALASVSGSVSDADGHASALIAALLKTPDSNQGEALGEALASVSGSVSDADGHASALLRALQATTDPFKCRVLGRRLASVSGSVSDADGHASALFAALRETPDSSQCEALARALPAVVGAMSEASEHAAELLAALRETTDSARCRGIGQALEAVLGSMAGATMHTSALLCGLLETTHPEHAVALGRALGAVSEVEPEASEKVPALLAALRDTSDPSRCEALGQALAAVSRYKPDASRHASALLGALRETTDPCQCKALGQALAAVSRHMPDWRSYSSVLIVALRETTVPVQRAALGQALAAVSGTRLEAREHASALLAALRETIDPRQCRLLGQALAAVSGEVPETAEFASALLAALWQTTDPRQCRALAGC